VKTVQEFEVVRFEGYTTDTTIKIKMPVEALILCVKLKYNKIILYVLAESYEYYQEDKFEERGFFVSDIASPPPENLENYLGSIFFEGEMLHLFELRIDNES